VRVYDEIGPDGQRPGLPLAGGEGAHTAATASSGSRERMRGRSQGRFPGASAARSGAWGFEDLLCIPLSDAPSGSHDERFLISTSL
jgi:hypothetical protein